MGTDRGTDKFQLDNLLEDRQLQDHVLDPLPVTEVNVYTYKHTSSHFISLNYCNTHNHIALHIYTMAAIT